MYKRIRLEGIIIILVLVIVLIIDSASSVLPESGNCLKTQTV